MSILSQECKTSFQFSQSMQQRLHFLQLPLASLAGILEEEVMKNPVLEMEEARSSVEEEFTSEESERSFKREKEEYRDEEGFEEREGFFFASGEEREREEYRYQLIQKESSLIEKLSKYIWEFLETETEKKASILILGELEESGFLQTDLGEMSFLYDIELSVLQKVLFLIQREIEPGGIGASCLRESLLLQLEKRGKKNTHSYRVIRDFYSLLLNNQITRIAKKIHLTPEELFLELKMTFRPLSFRPLSLYQSSSCPDISIDLSVCFSNGSWAVQVHQEDLPEITIASIYRRMIQNASFSSKIQKYIQKQILSGKLLLSHIDQRKALLVQMGKFLIEHQRAFLEKGVSALKPMQMQQLARYLSVHESTITRAVSQKYIRTPHGTFPLRFFFSSGYNNSSGDALSSHTIRKKISQWVEGEDKRRPFSDEQISKKLSREGISCARRTVSKYRRELSIPSKAERKRNSPFALYS